MSGSEALATRNRQRILRRLAEAAPELRSKLPGLPHYMSVSDLNLPDILLNRGLYLATLI